MTNGSNFSNTMFATPDSDSPDLVQGTFAPGSIEIKVTIDAVFELE